MRNKRDSALEFQVDQDEELVVVRAKHDAVDALLMAVDEVWYHDEQTDEQSLQGLEFDLPAEY
jgi:hypothetical protein